MTTSTSGKEPDCQCRRHKRGRLDPWVGKIPQRRDLATHSRIPAWRIPWTEQPDRFQSMGLQRVGYNWGTNTFTFCHTAKYKLGFKEAEEPESKLPTFVGSWTKQRSSRKTSTSASLTMLKPLTVWIIINWKILKETGIPDHFTCLLRNLHKGQEATGRTRHGTTDWLQSGQEVQQSCILSPAYLTSMWRTSLEMRGWMEHRLESTLPGEITTSNVKMISL